MARPPTDLPERLTIRALHDRGYSDAQIARALGLTPSACKQALADARAVLEAHAVSLVTDYLTASDIAARKGDHRPARDMLDRLHVTEPTPVEQQTNVGITVQVAGFTFPGLPVPPHGPNDVPAILGQTDTAGRLLPQGAPSPAIDVLPAHARPENQEPTE